MQVSLPMLFSFLFYIATILIFFYGLYIYSYNSRSMMHRIFLLSCLSLSIWNFSFSIANSAISYQTALTWRRVAAIGWGSFFSLVLHFILLYTNQRKLLTRKVTYVILYLPIIINIFIFSVNAGTVNQVYDLLNTDVGWINLSKFTVYDWWYNFYYASFTILSLVLLFQWGIRSRDKKRLKEMLLIGSAYIVTFIAGTITEFVANIYLSVRLPQLGPVLILLPMSAMFYCVKSYGMLIPEWVKQDPEDSNTLNDNIHQKLYSYLTIAFIFGGFINFAAQFFTYREALKPALLFSLCMVLVGLSMRLIQNLRIKLLYKDYISNLIMAISIPAMIIKYFQYSNIYAWVVPIIFILIAVAFSRRHMLVLIVLSTLASLLYLWVKYPITLIHFNGVDHLIRIIVLGIILWIAFYINDFYQQRIKENEERAKHQSFLIKVSTILLATGEKNMDDCMFQALDICKESLKVDRIYIGLLFDEGTNNKVYERHRDGIPSVKEELETANWNKGLRIVKKIREKSADAICVYDASTLLGENGNDNWLHNQPIKSMAINPLLHNDQIIGFLVLESVVDYEECKPNQKETIILLAHMISNIWIKIKAEQELTYKAYYDELTGLANRAMIIEKLKQEITSSDQLFGILYFDIDNFKSFNDIMGHDGGNLVLQQAAMRLKQSTGQEDVISRIGGDEFLIMTGQASSKEIIIERSLAIMNEFQKPVTVNDQNFYITASMGISIAPSDGNTPEELIKNAEIAMQYSKDNGRNKYTLFTDEMKCESITNNILIKDLHLAVEREEFVLCYQPQIDLISKEMIGVEALIRWQHPEKGRIMPGTFISLAEKTGLIVKIGKWVLREACRQSVEWQRKGARPIRMAVNISLGQFLDPKLITELQEIIQSTGIEPGLLELEVTESIAAFDHEQIGRILRELKQCGVDISIDDFGTEYSSLIRIKTMPIDKIKIDQRFIRGISSNNKDEEIIKVILQMGKIFGLKVIAEGVETEKELIFLESNDCDEVQGYYFYQPLAVTDIEQLLFR